MNILQRMSQIMLLGASVSLVNTAAAQELDLENEDNQIGYAIGVNIGQNLVQQQIVNDIEIDAFMTGLRDAIGGELQMQNEQIMAALQTFMQRQQEAQQSALSDNLAASQEFLAENAQRDGVVTLDSGLQYMVMEEGAAGGASPTASDSVLAHYHGTLPDGSVFDSSVERGEPATFGLSQVIPGWTEALQLMSVGDKWRLFLPPDLAYGEASPTPEIGRAHV